MFYLNKNRLWQCLQVILACRKIDHSKSGTFYWDWQKQRNIGQTSRQPWPFEIYCQLWSSSHLWLVKFPEGIWWSEKKLKQLFSDCPKIAIFTKLKPKHLSVIRNDVFKNPVTISRIVDRPNVSINVLAYQKDSAVEKKTIFQRVEQPSKANRKTYRRRENDCLLLVCSGMWRTIFCA
jgi:hypothetical protein